MNFLSFEYFLAVEKAGSIRGAAAELCISQQALSEQLHRLEGELGVKLIAATRPATLTPCGKRFAEYAAFMRQERRVLERDLAELSGKQRELVISISAANCPPMLSDAIADFSADYPDCSIVLKERRENLSGPELMEYDLNISSESLPGELEQLHIQSQMDASNSVMHTGEADMTSNRLAVFVHRRLLEKYWGAACKEKLCRLNQEPDVTLFSDIPFIRVNRPNNDEIDRLLLEKSFIPRYVSSTDTFDMGFSLCCAGVGALLVPDGMVIRKLGQTFDRDQLLLFPVGTVFPPLDMIVSYQKGRELSEPERGFIAALVHRMDSPKGSI